MALKGHIKKLRRNKRAGIEGLPLQLMIIILVAALGTAVIVGWMGSLETPKYIGSVDVTSGNIQLSKGTTGITVEIEVTDQDGNPLEGATVILSGNGITDKKGNTPNMVTDENGCVKFTDLSIKKLSGIGYVDVTVTKGDHGTKSIQIVVIP